VRKRNTARTTHTRHGTADSRSGRERGGRRREGLGDCACGQCRGDTPVLRYMVDGSSPSSAVVGGGISLGMRTVSLPASAAPSNS
jgi:hypothetical protein